MKPLTQDGWTLETATSRDFDEIMTWFPDAASVDIWGGPQFRFPFTRASFLDDCQTGAMESYVLRDAAARTVAFGQSYEREGRGHLARLVTNPRMRRQGAGSKLIELIITSLEERHAFDEYSLFVYRDNVAAYECYVSLGFAVTDYPAGAAMADRCYFLTRPATRKAP